MLLTLNIKIKKKYFMALKIFYFMKWRIVNIVWLEILNSFLKD